MSAVHPIILHTCACAFACTFSVGVLTPEGGCKSRCLVARVVACFRPFFAEELASAASCHSHCITCASRSTSIGCPQLPVCFSLAGLNSVSCLFQADFSSLSPSVPVSSYPRTPLIWKVKTKKNKYLKFFKVPSDWTKQNQTCTCTPPWSARSVAVFL